jgi:hypothetical protein
MKLAKDAADGNRRQTCLGGDGAPQSGRGWDAGHGSTDRSNQSLRERRQLSSKKRSVSNSVDESGGRAFKQGWVTNGRGEKSGGAQMLFRARLDLIHKEAARFFAFYTILHFVEFCRTHYFEFFLILF